MSRSVNDILTDWDDAQSSVKDISAAIDGAVDNDANLDGLTSTSKTAEYSLWKKVAAIVGYIVEGIWDDYQSNIIAQKDAIKIGTAPWLRLEILKFQYGDALQWNQNTATYFYNPIDTTKQIIARCSVTKGSGVCTVKVAKLDSGNAVALTSAELTALSAYVSQIEFAGADIVVTSRNADLLNAPMTVYYDGTKKLEDIKAIVQTAFDLYLTQLPFNGEYSVNKHADFIENYGGTIIHEVDTGVVQAKSDTGTYNTVTRIYQPVSGYILRDSSIDYDTMITYVAE